MTLTQETIDLIKIESEKQFQDPNDSTARHYFRLGAEKCLQSTAILSSLKGEGQKDPVTHETFVVGFNDQSQVIFFKSYQYIKQKEEAQSDLKWVIDNCHHWEIGAASEWLLIHEDSTHEIIIKHP